MLTIYNDDVLLVGHFLTVLRRVKQKLTSRSSMTDVGDVSLVLGMGVARGREKGAVTVFQENYTKSLAVRHGKAAILSTHLVCEQSLRWTSWGRGF